MAVAERSNLINRMGLRGGFAWEISQDTNAAALSGQLANGLLH